MLHVHPAAAATAQGRPLLDAGALRAGGSFTRASSAFEIDQAGNFLDAAANAPRFGNGRGLLLEGMVTNGIRNPRGEGAIVGDLNTGAGAWPTYWSLIGTAPATLRVEATGTESGMPYIDLRMADNSTSAFAILFGSRSEISYASGISYTSSLRARLIAGSLTNMATQIDFFTSAGTQVGNIGFVPTTAPLSQQRASTQFTPSSSSNVVSRLRLVPSGAYDVTLRLSMPSIFLNSLLLGSDLLPPAGTLAASTRAMDLLSWNAATLFPKGAGTLYGRWVVGAQNSAPQFLAQIDDGASSNRLSIVVAGGGSAVQASLQVGGATTASLSPGAVPFGAAYDLAVAWSGTGISALVKGASVVTASGAAPTGLTRLLGGAPTSENQLNGRIPHLRCLPFRATDAALAGLLAGLPA